MYPFPIDQIVGFASIKNAASIQVLPHWCIASLLQQEKTNQEKTALIVLWQEKEPNGVLSKARKFVSQVHEVQVKKTGFIDYDPKEINEKTFFEKIFLPQPARELSEFLKRTYKEGTDRYIFSCEDGRTHSAGAARAFAKWLISQERRHKTSFLFWPVPNLSTERQLCRALFGFDNILDRGKIENMDDLEEVIDALSNKFVFLVKKTFLHDGYLEPEKLKRKLIRLLTIIYKMLSFLEGDFIETLLEMALKGLDGDSKKELETFKRELEEDLEFPEVVEALNAFDGLLWRLGL